MSDTKQLINSLDQKVDQLVSKLKQESQSSGKKDDEISSLKNKLSEQSSELDKLKSEIESMGKVEAVSNQADSSVAKQRIDELVNEIDKCISLIKV